MNPAEFQNIARVEESFWWYAGMRHILLSLLPRYLNAEPQRILEAGAGTGDFAVHLARRHRCPIDVLDLSAIGLRLAQPKGLDRLVQADLRGLPLRAAAYDLALCLDVIVHFPAAGEAPALAELARVLKLGGLLVLRVSALDILRSRHSQFVGERQRFTRGRLLAAVRAQGLEPLRCTYLNSLLLPVSLLKFRVVEPLTRAPAASGVAAVPAWLNFLLERVLRAESLWLSSGLDFPVGQSLLLFARKPADSGIRPAAGEML